MRTFGDSLFKVAVLHVFLHFCNENTVVGFKHACLTCRFTQISKTRLKTRETQTNTNKQTKL